MSYFSNNACANATTAGSLVVVRTGVCNLVPSSYAGTNFSSWRTTCNADNQGGVSTYCASPNCLDGTCTVRAPPRATVLALPVCASASATPPPTHTHKQPRAPPPPQSRTFTSGECQSNNPVFGSASLATQCAGSAPATAGALAVGVGAATALATVALSLAGLV